MTGPCDLELDLGMLAALLEASDIEAERAWSPRQAQASQALQIELWRMRRPLIGAAFVHQEDALEVVWPFARVAELLDPSAGGVLLSLRTSSRLTDFVQLRADHFHAAADFVRTA